LHHSSSPGARLLAYSSRNSSVLPLSRLHAFDLFCSAGPAFDRVSSFRAGAFADLVLFVFFQLPLFPGGPLLLFPRIRPSTLWIGRRYLLGSASVFFFLSAIPSTQGRTCFFSVYCGPLVSSSLRRARSRIVVLTEAPPLLDELEIFGVPLRTLFHRADPLEKICPSIQPLPPLAPPFPFR